MSPERLAQIKRLSMNSNPGPWVREEREVNDDSGTWSYTTLRGRGGPVGYGDLDEASWRLAMEAPVLVSELLAEVERLQAFVAEYRDRVSP